MCIRELLIVSKIEDNILAKDFAMLGGVQFQSQK